MKKGINKHPLWVMVLCLPIIWTYAILRALVTLPLWIIAKCNTVLNDIE